MKFYIILQWWHVRIGLIKLLKYENAEKGHMSNWNFTLMNWSDKNWPWECLKRQQGLQGWWAQLDEMPVKIFLHMKILHNPKLTIRKPEKATRAARPAWSRATQLFSGISSRDPQTIIHSANNIISVFVRKVFVSFLNLEESDPAFL